MHRRAGACRAINHIDGRDLALRLQEAAALHLGQALGHIFGYLILGGDGIAEEEAAPGLDGRLSDRLVPLHKHFLTHGAVLLTFPP